MLTNVLLADAGAPASSRSRLALQQALAAPGSCLGQPGWKRRVPQCSRSSLLRQR